MDATEYSNWMVPGKMNAGDGLLHSPDGAFKKFTFGTYIYVSEWVDGACLFKKVDGGSVVIAFQLGSNGR